MTTIALAVGRLAGRLDPAWVGLAVGLALLAAFAPAQATTSLAFLADALLGVAPFLALSVLLAAGAKASGADQLIARAFTGRLSTMVVLAAAVGAVAPFCSCGVIPLIAALLAMGVPLAPVMAFWLASPLMDPSMFVLTSGTLGFEFAVFKTIAAAGIGVLGGLGTWVITSSGLVREPLREGIGNGGCGGGTVRNPGPVRWRFWEEEERRGKFAAQALDSTVFLGKWLLVAFLLESLMVAYVPADLVAGFVGGTGLWPLVNAVVVGIPTYLNGYAALGLVDGLMAQGMSPGAAMAFMLAGGVSCIPAAVAVWALARPPVFAAYLGFATGGALLMGALYAVIV